MILTRDFYKRPTVDVARALLGKVLRHGDTAGIIVETEAYLGEDDLAAHSSRGITERTRVIFGPPGHAYVYLIYGMYECLNLVAEPKGKPGCVFIRAVEPIAGLDIMRQRRPTARKPEQLASGPGKLTIALGITRELNGCDVTRGPISVSDSGGQISRLQQHPASESRIALTGRCGSTSPGTAMSAGLAIFHPADYRAFSNKVNRAAEQ